MSADATLDQPRRLTWDDVKDGAEALFNVWFMGSELQWAESAWATLEKAGLTEYRNAVEETRVRVRLLTLASLYWDFCRLGTDEECGWDDLNEQATENLGIDPLRLGQVVGPAFEAHDHGADGADLLESALRHLIVEERPAIVAAVRKSHGDDWTFLKALFASIKLQPDPSGDGNNEPDLMQAAPVLSWITEGMPCL